MTDTVTAKLAEWEALANAATEGPWDTDGGGTSIGHGDKWVAHVVDQQEPNEPVQARADAEFIAAARHMAPALLAAVQGVLRVCDERRGGCGDDYTDGWTAGWADALLEVRRAITQQIGGEA